MRCRAPSRQWYSQSPWLQLPLVLILLLLILLVVLSLVAVVVELLSTATNLLTKMLEFRVFDSSTILMSRGGMFMSMGNFPEVLSQAILVGEIGRSIVCCRLALHPLYYNMSCHVMLCYVICVYRIWYHIMLAYIICDVFIVCCILYMCFVMLC